MKMFFGLDVSSQDITVCFLNGGGDLRGSIINLKSFYISLL